MRASMCKARTNDRISNEKYTQNSIHFIDDRLLNFFSQNSNDMFNLYVSLFGSLYRAIFFIKSFLVNIHFVLPDY